MPAASCIPSNTGGSAGMLGGPCLKGCPAVQVRPAGAAGRERGAEGRAGQLRPGLLGGAGGPEALPPAATGEVCGLRGPLWGRAGAGLTAPASFFHVVPQAWEHQPGRLRRTAGLCVAFWDFVRVTVAPRWLCWCWPTPWPLNRAGPANWTGACTNQSCCAHHTRACASSVVLASSFHSLLRSIWSPAAASTTLCLPKRVLAEDWPTASPGGLGLRQAACRAACAPDGGQERLLAPLQLPAERRLVRARQLLAGRGLSQTHNAVCRAYVLCLTGKSLADGRGLRGVYEVCPGGVSPEAVQPCGPQDALCRPQSWP